MTKYKISDLIIGFDYKIYDENDINLLNDNPFIKLSEDTIYKLIEYKNILKKINETVNLTAIRDNDEILKKHFIDSFYLQQFIKENDKYILDIGTGAGFPGMVLAILNPDKKFLLVDSVNKKIEFLKIIAKELKLNNVSFSSSRFEEIDKKYLEKFDIAFCRGVAHLSIIIEYIAPFLKINGRFYPQKLTLDETKEIENTLNIFNFKVLNEYLFNLYNDNRFVIELIKEKKTDKNFPRKNGMAKKNPYY